jgi:hypothetical protein
LADTLDSLREKCGAYGEAAVANARWGAIGVWLMKSYGESGLTNPYRVASNAIMLCEEEDKLRLGFPLCLCADCRSHARPVILPTLSPDVQAEARRVAAETVADWERAGQPYLTAERIRDTHKFIMACLHTHTDKETAA